MKNSKYGPCGLYCSACGAQDCEGCNSDIIDEYVQRCKFRMCSRDKGLDFCCFCIDYPCTELYEFMNDQWPHHRTMEPNLQFIRKFGLMEWLEAQKNVWSCPGCGVAIQWYQKKCTCGKDLDAWEIPD